jgi:hypothetical protein
MFQMSVQEIVRGGESFLFTRHLLLLMNDEDRGPPGHSTARPATTVRPQGGGSRAPGDGRSAPEFFGSHHSSSSW